MSNFLKKIFLEKRALLRLIFFLVTDAVLMTLSVFLAFLVRFEGQLPARYSANVVGIIFLLLVINLPIFYFSKLYYFSWIYVSTAELIFLAKATTLSFLLLAASFVVLKDHPVFTGFPRSTLLITYFFVFLLCGGIRFAKRIYLEIFKKNAKGRERALIAGAGDAGEQMLRSILNSFLSPYLPVGFVDDNPTKQGISIHGIKVLGRIEDIPKVVEKEKIEVLIVSLPSAGSGAIVRAVEHGRKAGLRKIKIVPPIGEVIDGKVGLRNLQEVEMEDLLSREPVILDQKSIKNFVHGKKVLVTGAAGSIGSELCRQLIKFEPSALLLLDQDETGIFNISEELRYKFPDVKSFISDICDKGKIERIFENALPEVVFHAAAYKHVPLMEEQPDEAVKNNVFGTKIVIDASMNCGAEKFVFISTDKSVNPTSIMGATKRIGEMLCQTANQKGKTKFVSVRFGNVLNSRGSVIPIFKEKIKRRETIEITHPDMKRYFMTTPEACLLVLQAGAMGEGGEVFILDMGDPVRIIDLAKELIRLSGLEPDKDIPIVFTEPRPGEKFFEELLTAEEGTIATQNQKIFMARLSQIRGKELKLGLDKLEKAVERGEQKAIIRILKELIPNYKKHHG